MSYILIAVVEREKRDTSRGSYQHKKLCKNHSVYNAAWIDFDYHPNIFQHSYSINDRDMENNFTKGNSNEAIVLRFLLFDEGLFVQRSLRFN